MNTKYIIVTKELRYSRIRIGVSVKHCSIIRYEPICYSDKELAIEELAKLDIGDLTAEELLPKIAQIRKFLKDNDKEMLDLFNEAMRDPKNPEINTSKLQSVAIDRVTGELVIRWSIIGELNEK